MCFLTHPEWLLVCGPRAATRRVWSLHLEEGPWAHRHRATVLPPEFSLGTRAFEPKTLYASPQGKQPLELGITRLPRVPSNRGKRGMRWQGSVESSDIRRAAGCRGGICAEVAFDGMDLVVWGGPSKWARRGGWGGWGGLVCKLQQHELGGRPLLVFSLLPSPTPLSLHPLAHVGNMMVYVDSFISTRLKGQLLLLKED